MKIKYLIIALSLALTGCYEGEKPIYDIGDQVIVNQKLKGTVIDTRTWISSRRTNPPTADYLIKLDIGATNWYDQEQLQAAK